VEEKIKKKKSVMILKFDSTLFCFDERVPSYIVVFGEIQINGIMMQILFVIFKIQ